MHDLSTLIRKKKKKRKIMTFILRIFDMFQEEDFSIILVSNYKMKFLMNGKIIYKKR